MTAPTRRLSPGNIPYDEVLDLVGAEMETDFVVGEQHRELFERGTMIDQTWGDELRLPEYPTGLIEGFHVLALLDPLLHPFIRFDPTDSVGWNYGLNRVRFINPVVAGKPYRLTAVVKDVAERETGRVVRLECQITDPDDPSGGASMLADWLAFVAPRSAAGKA